MLAETLPAKDLVLLGAGHTHAHVLRMARMDPLPGVRLTCVSDFPIATYSGMLPGVLAGQYAPEEMTVDLVRLCQSAGVRLVVGQVTRVDVRERLVHVQDRVPIPFDWLSVGIGSRPNHAGVAIRGECFLPIKPMQTFLERLDQRLEQLRARGSTSVRIVVVGAGAGGIEIACCLPVRVRRLIPEAMCEVALVQAHAEILGDAGRATQRRVLRELRQRRVALHTDRRVTVVDAKGVELHTGERLEADLVVWAASAVGAPVLGTLELPLDERGFLLTRPTLQSTGSDLVFAVGDAGTLAESPTPKAGVYAVRQGPVLWDNFQRLAAKQPLRVYRPQRDFLKLFNLGDGRALGEWRGGAFAGRWVWRWKNAIDTRFMAMYRDVEPSAMPVSRSRRPSRDDVSGPNRERCAGCGGKVGGSILARVLQRLDHSDSKEGQIGLESPDDAAVVALPAAGRIALTTDFFVSPFDDPYLLGRVAALHAASDCFAMGAIPSAALAMATLPSGSAKQQEQLLYEMLAGAQVEFRAMGTTLVGGHTLEGSESMLGFTLVADQTNPPTTKGGLRPGDALVLTRPLGTGVLFAAHMRARCRAEWWSRLVTHLLTSNERGAQIALRHEVRGMTDVSGFGLAGHLGEMLRASRVQTRLELDRIPLLPGVVELLQEGLESTLAAANRDVETLTDTPGSIRSRPSYQALFDPQTQGGLLLGVASDRLSSLLAELRAQGYPEAATIGEVSEAADSGPRWTVMAPSIDRPK